MRTFTLSLNGTVVQFDTSENCNTVLVSTWIHGRYVKHNPNMLKQEARDLYAQLRACGWKKMERTVPGRPFHPDHL